MIIKIVMPYLYAFSLRSHKVLEVQENGANFVGGGKDQFSYKDGQEANNHSVVCLGCSLG